MDTPAMTTDPSTIREDDPERELWRSVLELAIRDLSNLDEKRSAIGWFRSRRMDVVSFEWVCLVLDLESSSVRRALFRGLVERLAA